MTHSDETRRAAGTLGGLNAAANMDPDARRARASAGGRAAKAKRDAEKLAAGIPLPKPRRINEPLPERPELDAERESIRIERHEAGLPPLSYDAEIREATIRIRRAVAEATMAALKAMSQK